jgi:hypothetical protein
LASNSISETSSKSCESCTGRGAAEMRQFRGQEDTLSA